MTRGIAIAGDARQAGTLVGPALRARGLPDRVRLVVTSPPYLGLVRYGRANWLRLWLLGEDPTRVDGLLDRPGIRGRVGSAPAGRCSMTSDPILADDAVVVIIVGDIEADRGRRLRRPVDLAAATWESAAAAGRLPTGGRQHGCHRPGAQAHPPVGRSGRRGIADRSAAGHRTHGAGSATGAGQREPGRRPGAYPRYRPGAPERRLRSVPAICARSAPSRRETRYPRLPCSRCTTRTTWHRWIRSS